MDGFINLSSQSFPRQLTHTVLRRCQLSSVSQSIAGLLSTISSKLIIKDSPPESQPIKQYRTTSSTIRLTCPQNLVPGAREFTEVLLSLQGQYLALLWTHRKRWRAPRSTLSSPPLESQSLAQSGIPSVSTPLSRASPLTPVQICMAD